MRRVLKCGMCVVNGVSWADDVEAVEVSQEPTPMKDPETGEMRPGYLIRAKLLLEKSRWVPANPDGTVNAEARDAVLDDMRESFKTQLRKFSDDKSKETLELFQGLTQTMGVTAQWGAGVASRLSIHARIGHEGETVESRAQAQREFVAENRVG